MTNRKFNVVPVKTSIVTADKIILIDSEDSNKLKQADATAFKGTRGDIGATGPAGANGTNGTNGTDGANGADGRGVVSETLISTVGKVKTYRITYTDSTFFDRVVTDGADGVGTGDMLKADNLSGLANYETARANLAIIDDITPSTTKAYSSDKTQAMHNAQAQAIQNLSGGGSQCEPLQDYQGTAIIGVLGTYVFGSSKTGTKYILTSDSIPVGSNLIVELRKNSYTTGNVLSSTLQIATTDTLTNGKKTVSITDTDSYVAGDYVVAYLTSVGSTTPALNPYFTLTVS